MNVQVCKRVPVEKHMSSVREPRKHGCFGQCVCQLESFEVFQSVGESHNDGLR